MGAQAADLLARVEITLSVHTRSLNRFPSVLQAAVLVASPLTALAGATVPGAGTILQDLKPIAPPVPAATAPQLTIEQRGIADVAPTAAFSVKIINLSGNTAFNTPTLQALLADAEDHELTLSELNARVSRITDFYHAHGYPLARALIPAQTIRDGVIEVQIIEARFGQIQLDNHSRVRSVLLQSTLAPLKRGQAIEQSRLEHVLLLLADIPGVRSSSTLQPGANSGTSDLLAQAAPVPGVAGIVTLDNYGNRYTGRARAGGEISFDNLLHHGDVLDASGLTSGRDMTYGRGSYDVLLNGRGTHLGGAYSALGYRLGSSLGPLEAHGSARVGSLWVRQPLRRTRDVNLYAHLQFDRKDLRDHIDVAAIRTDRNLDNGTASLAGDWRDRLLGGGVTSGSVQWVVGKVGFDDATAQRADAASVRTQGRFSQWNATLARLQFLNASNALYLTVSRQWANGNLDPSQKLVAGGRYTVRAYDMSAASGDTGSQASAEVRHDLTSRGHGQWQMTAFLDAEHITINKIPWTREKNDATLRGAGVGLNWTGASRWSVRASLAARLGAASSLVANSTRVRGWVELSRSF